MASNRYALKAVIEAEDIKEPASPTISTASDWNDLLNTPSGSSQNTPTASVYAPSLTRNPTMSTNTYNGEDNTVVLPFEDTLKKKRRAFYEEAWKTAYQKQNYKDAESAILRFLDIIDGDGGAGADLECYTALAISAGIKSTAIRILERAHTAHFSVGEQIILKLLRILLLLSDGSARASIQCQATMKDAYQKEGEQDCYFVMAVIQAFGDDKMEMAFYQPMFPDNFAPDRHLLELINVLPFEKARWPKTVVIGPRNTRKTGVWDALGWRHVTNN